MVPVRVLYKCRKHFAASLQEGVSDDNLQEPLQALPTMFYHVVRKAVCQDLAWKRWYRDPGGLALQDVAKPFEVLVSAAHRGRFELKRGNIGSHHDLVSGVHSPTDAMGHGIADFNLEEILRGSVKLLE